MNGYDSDAPIYGACFTSCDDTIDLLILNIGHIYGRLVLVHITYTDLCPPPNEHAMPNAMHQTYSTVVCGTPIHVILRVVCVADHHGWGFARRCLSKHAGPTQPTEQDDALPWRLEGRFRSEARPERVVASRRERRTSRAKPRSVQIDLHKDKRHACRTCTFPPPIPRPVRVWQSTSSSGL
jgi:hypothetical protein